MRIALTASAALILIFTTMLNALDYTRTTSFPTEPFKREKVMKQTMVFAENELPYNLMQNLLHRWPDRPLFADVKFRNMPEGSMKSAEKDIEVCKMMGLDGLASLHHYALYFKRLNYFKVPVPGYSDLFVLPAYLNPDDKETETAIRQALASKFTMKLDGKLVIWNYGGEENDRAVRFAKRYRNIPEFKNKLLFFGNVPFIDVYKTYYRTVAKGYPMPEKVIKDFEAKCREVLDHCDGMILWVQEHYRHSDSDYAYHILSTPIYRDYLLPVVKKLMLEKQYKNKLWGTFPRSCYINRFMGSAFGEFGTEGIRTYLDESMLLNPDMMVLFEWNEANENTYFQPSVNNGRCLERILNYYLQKLRGEAFAGRPGDDPTVPNLVFSARKKLCLGETVHLELLNVPDRNTGETYHAQLVLRDESGKTVAEFPEETFRKNEMKAVTYRLPSEQFNKSLVLVPEIKVGNKVYREFGGIELHPTSCKEYKSVLTCLRELVPAVSDFQVTKKTDHAYAVKVAVHSATPLASVEVLIDNEEVYAYDKTHEFDPEKYDVFRGLLTSHSSAPAQCGTMTVEHSRGWKIRSAFFPYQSLDIQSPGSGNFVKIKCGFRGGRAPFILSVPKKEMENAAMQIHFDNGNNVTIPLRDVRKLGKYSWNFPSYMRLELSRNDLLPDMVPHVGEKNVAFSAIIRTDKKHPVFQLRLIDENGKLYRKSIVPEPMNSKTAQEITVYSDYYKTPVKVRIAEDRIPDLNYQFNPSYGARFVSGWENQFDILLGGGFDYGEPMNRQQGQYLANQYKNAPQAQWSKNGDGVVLSFNGQNEYLCLPQEILPHNSRYTLDFEIRPQTASNQILLRSLVEGRSSGLELAVADGKLRGIFYGKEHAPVIHDTGLDIIPGKWNRIRIFKDYKTLTYEVNARRKSFPYDRRASRFTMHVFGALQVPGGKGIPTDCKPFHGELRKFCVLHDIRPEE